jgi:hypothetical protein
MKWTFISYYIMQIINCVPGIPDSCENRKKTPWIFVLHIEKSAVKEACEFRQILFTIYSLNPNQLMQIKFTRATV